MLKQILFKNYYFLSCSITKYAVTTYRPAKLPINVCNNTIINLLVLEIECSFSVLAE